jgi:preprotein translocase subunit SecF
LTVLLTLVVLMLFGGVTIRTFVLALLVGITTGTYSSIFVASMLLVSWNLGELRWLWPFGGRGATAPARA